MRNTRNCFGVKNACDLYRTVGGVQYVQWASDPADHRIAAYRAAGVRCRRFGGELFVHPLHTDMATEIDRRPSPATTTTGD